MKKKYRIIWIVAAAAAVLLALLLWWQTAVCYRADATAAAALLPDETVRVEAADYGWLFDGPGEQDALIFYPGALVETAAYAPLARRLAASGLDVCLVNMPAHLALLGKNRAAAVQTRYPYERWYIGGHSLGGMVAALYAAAQPERLTGVILCAAYPTKPLDDSLTLVSVYGSADGVLRREKLAAGRRYYPATADEYVIEGGNHAQFGNYGPQKGDGTATIGADEQQKIAAASIMGALAPPREGEI